MNNFNHYINHHFDIPFIDLKFIYKKIGKEINHKFAEILKRQWFIFGPELQEFENKFADYLNVPYCVGVKSGFDALKFSLKMFNLKKEDEVILPANTFIATFLSVIAAGAKPVLCDVDPYTCNISPDTVEKMITKKTKVIIPVHLFGNPAPVHILKELCISKKIHLLEDACQAHGASLKNQKIGTFGIFSAFSFYPGKNIGAFGDGGAIICHDPDYYKELLRIRNYGQIEKGFSESYGENSRLNEIQSAVLNIKLPYLSAWNEIRRKNAALYRKYLSQKIGIQKEIEDGKSCFHSFIILVKKRNNIYDNLRKNGIECLIHYPYPIHKQPAYKKLFPQSRCFFPVSESFSRKILSLPVDIHMNEQKIKKICDIVNSFCD